MYNKHATRFSKGFTQVHKITITSHKIPKMQELWSQGRMHCVGGSGGQTVPKKSL